MIYPEISAEEWAKKWGLPLGRAWECPNCAFIFPIDVPIYMQEVAGFESTKHDCGPDMTKVILAPRTEKSKAFWNRVVGAGVEEKGK